jgi:hypothetical protein
MRVFLIGVFWLLSGSVLADISNATDYEGLQRFPESTIVQYKRTEERDYRQVLGVLEKINGVLRPEKEQRLAGTLTEITYRIPQNHTPEEAFNHLYNQIVAQGGMALFKCQGRACGSSNQWANNIFRYFRLYGVDSTQWFASLKLNQSHISLYAVQRGNKRVYLRLDILDQGSPQIAVQESALTQGREVVDEDQEIDALVVFLNDQPNQVIWLVAHDWQSGSISLQLKRSQARAEAFKARLIAAGANPERILIHAAGAFSAPADTDRKQRLIVYSEKQK